jgi:hypothetical protein
MHGDHGFASRAISQDRCYYNIFEYAKLPCGHENHPIQFRESEGGGASDAIRAVEDNEDPIPILVIDDFNVTSKENEE